MRKIVSVVVLVASSIAFSFGCGGGGPGIDASVNELYGDAMDALKAGDIRSANELFDATLMKGVGESADLTAIADPGISVKGVTKADVDLSTIITQSYFGRAFTDIILISESQPATDILAGLGQPAFDLSTLFGSTGYLAASHAIRKADDIAMELTGAKEATIDLGYAMTNARTNSFPYQSTYVWSNVVVPSSVGEIMLNISLTADNRPSTRYSLTGVCDVMAGDVISVDALCEVEDLMYGVTASGPPYSLSLRINDASYTVMGGSGTITVNNRDTVEGGTFSVTLTDVSFSGSGGEVVTLNGTFSDRLQSDTATPEGMPFETACHRSRCVASQVTPGYRSSNVLASLDELQPIWDGIVSDLEAAVADSAAAFDIPKELYFGHADIHVNRSDMQMMLAGSYAAKAALNFINSWSFDIALDGLVDVNGGFVGDKSAIVAELNNFFQLRPDHQLAEAQTNLTNAFSNAALALEAINGGATGGVLESKGENMQFYMEAYDLLTDATQALGGMTMSSVLMPQVGADLAYVFAGNIDGANVQMDPFVLEYGSIRPVEAYFAELIGDATTYDVSNRGNVKIFSSAVRSVYMLSHKLFPNMFGQFMGGHRIIGKFGWGASAPWILNFKGSSS